MIKMRHIVVYGTLRP